MTASKRDEDHNKDLSAYVFMDMKHEHTSIIDKNVRSFARAVVEVFRFSRQSDFWSTSFIDFIRICEKVKFDC